MKRSIRKLLYRLAAVLTGILVLGNTFAIESLAAPKKTSARAKYAMAFDAQYYAETYPDVVAAYGNDYDSLLTHYINNGVKEGRNASATFNAKAYREYNEDLDKAYGDKWAEYHVHYAVFGVNENRKSVYGKGRNNAKPAAAQPKAVKVNAGNIFGTYTTKYDAKVARATNVGVAASRINGVVVKRGESFSFNQTILPRTSANGYVVAPIFLNKKHASGIGGGVCQVSSTLYAAMLSAGLPATERHPHSLPVTYIPAGMDATIAGNSLDLKFDNIFDFPIVIYASADNGVLTVSIARYE